MRYTNKCGKFDQRICVLPDGSNLGGPPGPPGLPGPPGPPGRNGHDSGSSDVGQYIAEYLQSKREFIFEPFYAKGPVSQCLKLSFLRLQVVTSDSI